MRWILQLSSAVLEPCERFHLIFDLANTGFDNNRYLQLLSTYLELSQT